MTSTQLSEKKTSVVFRNINNEDIKCTYDNERIISVLELKNELKTILNKENNESIDEVLKFFFKGRPLKDEEFLKHLSLSNNDVILYMRVLKQKNQDDSIAIPVNNDNDNETTRTLNAENLSSVDEHFFHRGFNRFLFYGVPPSELQLIRILFHSAIYQQGIRRGVVLDWSREGILEREERWMRAQSNDRNNLERGIIIRLLNRYDSLNLEPSMMFIKGLLLGILFNIFGILLLLIWNFSPKFKCGLKLGIIIGTIFFIFPYLLIRK